MTRRIGLNLAPVVVILVLLALWQLLPELGVNSGVVPSLSLVLQSLATKRDVYALDLMVTFEEVVLGFAVGLLLGLGSGFTVVYSKRLRPIVTPLLVVSQTVPVIALAPLLVIVMGFGIAPRVTIVALGVFFPIALSTIAGVQSADPDYVNLLRSLSASRLAIFRKVELPSAAPHILTGMEIGITYSVIGAVVAEWVGADHGLGRLMLVRTSAFGIEITYGAIVLSSLLALILFGAVRLARSLLLPWERAVSQ